MLALIALLALLPAATAYAAQHAETIIAFDIESGELPEGVTVDSGGNVFVSLSPLGQLRKVAAGSDVAAPFGTVEGLQEGDIGLIGLAVDNADNVYGAVFSANPEANGVWQFDGATGEAQKVPGTEAITMPNSIAFDDAGTMYVTDTILGAVWRVPQDGAAEPWIVNSLLEGDGSLGFPFPLGANGIGIKDGVVYVGTTESAMLLTIPIQPDGSAGEVSVYAEVGDPVDGIALDAAGNVYIAAPASNSVLRVNVDGSIETLATAEDGLDAPTSVALATGEDGQPVLYTVNFSIAVAPPGGAGPALVRLALEPSMAEEGMAEGATAAGARGESATAEDAPQAGDAAAQMPATLPTTGAAQTAWPAGFAVVALLGLVAGGSVLLKRRRQD